MGEFSRLSEDFREQAHEAIQFYGYSSPLFRRVTGIDFDIAELYRILDRHDPMHVTRNCPGYGKMSIIFTALEPAG